MKRIGQFIILLFILVNPLFSQEIEHTHSIQHSFIENKGQWDENVLFQSKFKGGNLWIQQNKFLFHFQDFSAMHNAHAGKLKDEDAQNRQTFVSLTFLGSNTVENIKRFNPTPNYYNYFIGNDKSKWASDVHGYTEAILSDFYTGIDLKLIENKEDLKYEFHIKPNVDPNRIQLEYAGQKSLTIDKDGNLVIETELGRLIERKPYSYQIINGKVVEVLTKFKIENKLVTFDLGKYNPEVELVIDPVLVFATYSGSYSDNFGMTATYSHNGDAYSGGTVFGNGYQNPDPSAYNVSSNFTDTLGINYGITDVIISKYNSTGTQMLWSTYLGGGDSSQGTETVHSLIADSLNNLYLFGATSSLDFPIQNGFQSVHGGGVPNFNFFFNGVYFLDNGTDIYVAKLSSNGQNLMGSTYIGGSSNDGVNAVDQLLTYTDAIYSGTHYNANSIIYDSLTPNYGDNFRGEVMLDENENVIVASCTRSANFPVNNAFQPAIAGKQDGVIFKLSNNLSTLVWSSYFGGTKNDACFSVKVDSSDNIVFAGGTCSPDLQNTSGSWMSSYNGGKADGFVGKLSSNGLVLTKVTYVGTTNTDAAQFIEIDRNNNIFLLGQSKGGGFPVVNATFVNPNTCQYICKIDPTLSNVLNSTTFGNGSGATNISPAAFLVDVCGNLYISGWGSSVLPFSGITPLTGMPLSTDANQPTTTGFDFYLMVVDRTFSTLLFGSYLGGGSAKEHVDGGTSRFDKNGVVYQSVCGGCNGYSDFPVSSGCWSDSNKSMNHNCNNIVFKFKFDITPKIEFTANDTIGCAAFVEHFTNTSTASGTYLWDFGNGTTSSTDYNPTITYTDPGVYDVYLYVTDSVCLYTDTAKTTITVLPGTQVTTDSIISLCSPVPIVLTANSYGTASSFVWSNSVNFTDTLNTFTVDSTLSVTPPSDVTYYVRVDNGTGCSSIDSVQIRYTSSLIELQADTLLCFGDTTTVFAISSEPFINFTYAWSPSSIIVTPSLTNSVQVVPATTQYVVLSASGNGCFFQDSILVSVGNIGSSVVATASEIYIPEGDTVILIAQPNGYSYTWTPTVGLSNPNAQQTQAIVDHTTTYTVFVSDGICTRSDTVLVQTFQFVCDQPYLFVPNAFSPNGDNENDVLYVRGAVIKEMIFRVYDRWGEMVFESFDRAHGWDGTFRGKKMDPDVYDYYLKVTCIDEVETIIKGNITLLK